MRAKQQDFFEIEGSGKFISCVPSLEIYGRGMEA
jgi:hypothetical protein